MDEVICRPVPFSITFCCCLWVFLKDAIVIVNNPKVTQQIFNEVLRILKNLRILTILKPKVTNYRTLLSVIVCLSCTRIIL